MGCCCSSEEDVHQSSNPSRPNAPRTRIGTPSTVVPDVSGTLVPDVSGSSSNHLTINLQEDRNVSSDNIRTDKKPLTEMNTKQNNIDILYNQNDLLKLSISHKAKGNEYFKLLEYKKAIDEYSKAIKLYPSDSTYYSNRALCYKLLGEWQKVIDNCEISFNLDQNNYKAVSLKGTALVELGKDEVECASINQGIFFLNQSLEIYMKTHPAAPDSKIQEDIMLKLKKAKKILWFKQKDLTVPKLKETKKFINNLINNEETQDPSIKHDMLQTIEHMITENKKMENLDKLEIPEYMCCKITFEIMKEPIITPDGICYEKKTLQEHISRNGQTDPVTRKHFDSDKLHTNNALAKAIDKFQDKNPWSHDFITADEDYRQILL